MSQPDYQCVDITRKIIGCAMKAHSTLGDGFQEMINRRALTVEMNKHGFSLQRAQMIGFRR